MITISSHQVACFGNHNFCQLLQMQPLVAAVRYVSTMPRLQLTRTWGGTSVLHTKPALFSALAPQPSCCQVSSGFSSSSMALCLLVYNLPPAHFLGSTGQAILSHGADPKVRSNVPAHSVSTIFSRFNF